MTLDDDKLYLVKSIVNWYCNACNNPSSQVLRHPEFGRWKSWDDDQLFCSIFFAVAAKKRSIEAREYLDLMENHNLNFELQVSMLTGLSYEKKLMKIWEFGKGKNRLNKCLGLYFSTPGNIGRKGNYERTITDFFCAFEDRGFKAWLIKMEKIKSERDRAKQLEFVPGIKLKASRDFLNDIGMTNSLVALDSHVLSEMREIWKWKVPENTPSSRKRYLEIEDGVRDIARRIAATVLEIDKAIYYARSTGEYSSQ